MMTLRAAMITTTANTLLSVQTVSFRFCSSYGKTPIKRITTTTIPKNMILRHCTPIPTKTPTTVQNKQNVVICSRRLVIIMAWMFAKDTHLEKYRKMWFKRGFDVLTVKSSPIDLLLPPIGGKVVANNLANYLLEMSPQYRQIVIHAFSVGCYLFAELLIKLRTTDEFKIIGDSIRGVITDSLADTDDATLGLSRAITTNGVLQPLVQSSIFLFYKLFREISVKNYELASNEFHNMYLRCPALVFYSEDDMVGNANSNKRVISAWNKLGMCVQSKFWNSSLHVSHYREHTHEYEQQIDAFIKLINLNKSTEHI